MSGADRKSDAKQLNSFLRGELSAVETYAQAIEKVEAPRIRADLQECQASHQERATQLRDYITRLGAEPSDGSGVWGGFAKLVEGGAKAFGEAAALSALEEGEDHGRNDYQRELDDLSAEARLFVQSQLLPEQQRTHAMMSTLKHSARST
jgi:uncharacterized protein (TIGR02284 family)